MTAESSTGSKKPNLAFTVGSRVRVRSAGGNDEALVSQGVFRGLVSVGGDNSLAIELDDSVKEEKGRIRLVPLNALLAVDVMEAAKPEEERRSEPSTSPGYFR